MEMIIIFVAAIALDLVFGDPPHIPHPIVWIGKLIGWLEKQIRKSGTDLMVGGLTLIIGATLIVLTTISVVLAIAGWVHPLAKTILTIYLLYTSLAAKCLKTEVMKVYKQLKDNNLPEARRFISYLVGRDTTGLTSEEITRAAVETTAENTVDGILAPLFYMLLGLIAGVPVQAVFLYKTINTLDSMVGYIQEPYREIGFFSAKTDDVVNYLPARFGSALMLLAGGMMGYDLKNGCRILKRDRRNHKSPNCGYPESAAAGLLGIQIGGTNTYFNQVLVKPTIGDPIRPMEQDDIKRTIKIMYGAQLLQAAISIALLILFI